MKKTHLLTIIFLTINIFCLNAQTININPCEGSMETVIDQIHLTDDYNTVRSYLQTISFSNDLVEKSSFRFCTAELKWMGINGKITMSETEDDRVEAVFATEKTKSKKKLNKTYSTIKEELKKQYGSPTEENDEDRYAQWQIGEQSIKFEEKGSSNFGYYAELTYLMDPELNAEDTASRFSIVDVLFEGDTYQWMEQVKKEKKTKYAVCFEAYRFASCYAKLLGETGKININQNIHTGAIESIEISFVGLNLFKMNELKKTLTEKYNRLYGPLPEKTRQPGWPSLTIYSADFDCFRVSLSESSDAISLKYQIY